MLNINFEPNTNKTPNHFIDEMNNLFTSDELFY